MKTMQYTIGEMFEYIFLQAEKMQERCQMHVLNVQKKKDGAFALTFVDNAFCNRFPAKHVKRWTATFFAKNKTDIKRALKDLAKHRRDAIARYKRGESA